MNEKPTVRDQDNNAPSASIVELFHMVRSLIPGDQKAVTVTPETTVAEAVEIMKEHGFSQLPVVSGNAVLGNFSYRSLTSKLLQLKTVDADLRDLPVDEFMEWSTFVQPTDKWEATLEILNREDAVLVGNRDNLQGIVTSMDVLTYLHRLASPFVMLAEIELSLRRIIEACVDGETLRKCTVNSLASKYAVENMPPSPSAMTFNDYVSIIGDSRNWPYFEPAFGKGNWMRKNTIARLTEVRDLRNVTFHFKRQLDQQDYTTLAKHRDWLEMKTRAFEGRKRLPRLSATPAPATPSPTTPSLRRTNQEAMLAACSANAVPFMRWILDEAAVRGLITNWGTKGFSLRVQLPDRAASFAYGYPPNVFEVYFHNDLQLSAAEESQWRRELMAFGVLRPGGKKTLRAEIDAANTPVLRDLFTHLVATVASRTRYPLHIQAPVEGKLVVAELLDETGRVLFDGKGYGSVSGAAKAATRWPNVNGWTFWQYFDAHLGQWRPIDELRKHEEKS